MPPRFSPPVPRSARSRELKLSSLAAQHRGAREEDFGGDSAAAAGIDALSVTSLQRTPARKALRGGSTIRDASRGLYGIIAR